MHMNIIGLTFIAILLNLFFTAIHIIVTEEMRLGISLVATISVAVLGVIFSLRRPFYGAILLYISGLLVIFVNLILFFPQMNIFSSVGSVILGLILILIFMIPGMLFMYAGRFSYQLYQEN
jgi:hypothetical protein